MSKKRKTKKKVSPREVRKGRAFLRGQGFTTQMIPPRTFVQAAADSGETFAKTLQLLAKLKTGGQGQGQAPVATEIAEANAEH